MKKKKSISKFNLFFESKMFELEDDKLYNNKFDNVLTELRNQFTVITNPVYRKVVAELWKMFEFPHRIKTFERYYICSVDNAERVYKIVDDESDNNVDIDIELIPNKIIKEFGRREVDDSGKIRIVVKIDSKMLNIILKMKEKHTLEEYENYDIVRRDLIGTIRHELDHAAQTVGKETIRSLIDKKFGENYYINCFLKFINDSNYQNIKTELKNKNLKYVADKIDEKIKYVLNYSLTNKEISTTIMEYKATKMSKDEIIDRVVSEQEYFFKTEQLDPIYVSVINDEKISDFINNLLNQFRIYFSEAYSLKFEN